MKELMEMVQVGVVLMELEDGKVGVLVEMKGNMIHHGDLHLDLLQNGLMK
jgi:hypothetical protein